MNTSGTKTKPIGTILSVVLSLAAVGLYVSHLPIAAAIALVAAYFASSYDFKMITASYQFILGLVFAFAAGYMIEQPLNGHFPFLGTALFFAVLAFSIRVQFYATFNYTSHLWVEPVLLVLSIASYIYGNVSGHYGWAGWVIPAPIMLFCIAIGLVNPFSGIKLLGLREKIQLAEVGKPAPDFELLDQNGETVKLSDYKDKRNFLLLFVKGDWCPACHMMLRTYQKEKDKFKEKNTMILAIGPDPVGVNREMVSKLEVDYKILSDASNKIAGKYGLPVLNVPMKTEGGIDDYPLPASFLVGKDGIVHYSSRPDKVGEFLNPSLIFPILASLS